MKKYAVLFVAALLVAFCATLVWPQAQSAKVQGKITDNGKPVPNAQVVFTAAATGKVSKLKTDSTGAYSGVGLPVGEYKVQIIGASGESLFTVNKTQVTMDGGAPTILNIDLTKDRAAGNPALTKEQMEAIKAQNAKATALNALITQAQNAMNAKQWQEATDALRKMIDLDPSRPEFYQALGNAQFNLGHYQEAADAFEKGIATAQNAPSDPKTDPATAKAMLGQMLTMEGNAYIKLGKTDQAVALFTKAAAIDPNPGTAYFNLCATQYNLGLMDAAALSCDKAIAANPTKADAYFIKGSALYGNGKLDANNKYIVPPGTVDALKKYLELAPEGGHVADVKAMLEALGVKIETSYGQKKK